MSRVFRWYNLDFCMITLRQLSNPFGKTLGICCLQINGADRLALVGPNGAGQVDALQIDHGIGRPDAGEVQLRSGVASAIFLKKTYRFIQQTVFAGSAFRL